MKYTVLAIFFIFLLLCQVLIIEIIGLFFSQF
jgi:hypothetical protein